MEYCGRIVTLLSAGLKSLPGKHGSNQAVILVVSPRSLPSPSLLLFLGFPGPSGFMVYLSHPLRLSNHRSYAAFILRGNLDQPFEFH